VVRSANRTLLLVSGGERAGDEAMLEKARQSMEAGATVWVPRILSRPLTWSPEAIESAVWLREHLTLGHCQYPCHFGSDGSGESLRAVEWAAGEAVLRGVSLRIVSAVRVPAMIGLQVRPDHDFVADLVGEERDQALGAAAARAAGWLLACRLIPSGCPARPRRRSPKAGPAR
jgi:hypothetical protein